MDEKPVTKDPRPAKTALSIAREVADTVVDFIPVLGTAKLAAEAGLGKKIITGETLDEKGRYQALVDAAASTIPVIGPATRIPRKIQKVTKIAREIQQSSDRLQIEKADTNSEQSKTPDKDTAIKNQPQKQGWDSLFDTPFLSKEQINNIANKGTGVLQENLTKLKSDELTINDHIYAEKYGENPSRELDKMMERQDTSHEAARIYETMRNKGFTHQEISDLVISIKTGDFHDVLKKKISEEQKKVNSAVKESGPDLKKIDKNVDDFFKDNNAGGKPDSTPTIFLGKYASSVFHTGIDGNISEYHQGGTYHPDVNATTIALNDREYNSHRLNNDALHIYRHERVHSYSDSYKQGGQIMAAESSRKFRSGFTRLHGSKGARFNELNEGVTELFARKIAQRYGEKNFEVSRDYNGVVSGVQDLLEFLAQKRGSGSQSKELELLAQKYRRKTGLLELKRDIASFAGKDNAIKLLELENPSEIHNLAAQIPNSNPQAYTPIGQKQSEINTTSSQAFTLNNKNDASGTLGKANAFTRTQKGLGLDSRIPPNVSGNKTINQLFSFEAPGSQDVHDEITQTYSQPSPSFTPARVLNRQFVSRPVAGGGGRIPSLAHRSGNIMMRRLGMQAARIGAQLAAQAAIQTSRLLLNPYVLLAIGILLLILFIVAIITYTITGTGSTEEKKVSGTGGSCGPVTYKGSMNNLTDSEARAQLRAAGFGNDSIKAGVSLEGIKQNTICGIINFKNESGLNNNIVITSGTDGKHSTRGTYSHINGFKLDLRINQQIDNYIRSNYRQGATRRDGAAYYIGPRGNGFYREGNHWDIAFTGSNCHNMTEGQIADPNANPNTCEQTATDQTAPENTVLSVQDCSEKWASDINSNPYKQNFGDTDCDFDQSALYTLLTELDPDQADHWFNTVIKKESGYRPNFYSKSTNGNDEKWGLFQMGNGSANPVNRGDTGWRQQVTNAVTFCRELNNKQISCACYWESWGESCNIKK